MSSGSFGSVWHRLGAPSGPRVYSSSRGFTQSLVSVLGIIRIRVFSLSGATRGRLVHWGSSGFNRMHLGVIWFVRVRVDSAPSGYRVHSSSLRFT